MDKLEMEMLDLFLEETGEQIEKIEEELLLLESGQGNEETIHSIFRMIHSIKGASGMMGFEEMTTVSHHFESILSKVREKEITIDKEIVNIFFKSIDTIKNIYQCIHDGVECNIDIKKLIKKLKKVAKNKKDIKKERLYEKSNKNLKLYKIMILMDKDTEMKCIKAFQIINNISEIGSVIETIPRDFETIDDECFGDTFEVLIKTDKGYKDIQKNMDDITQINIDIEKVNKKQNKEKEDLKPNQDNCKNKREGKNTIRIDVNKIDKLLKLVGEFIIDKENLNQITSYLKKVYKNDPYTHKLVNTLAHINLIGAEMQETVMSTRMLKLNHIFHRFPRMVRDISLKCNKEINFIIEGSETEIDRGMIEELVDPFTHILRNAIDHGIEEKEERIKKGKNPVGILKLSARHEESNVVITVEDDGRGMDINKIKEKAYEKDFIKEEVRNISEKDILNLIFEPGFSTAKKVSDLSGRGVGLDVVDANIRKLSGMIDVKTEKEKGTKFTIKLPLTLAITQALLIKEGEYTFAIPIYTIIEILRLKDMQIHESIHTVGDIEVFDWRGEAIEVVRLGEYFGLDDNIASNKLFVIIVGFAEKKFAFIANKLMGEQEIVIKPMGDFIGDDKLFGNIHGISGVSILGDGSFAQIIDLASISRR